MHAGELMHSSAGTELEALRVRSILYSLQDPGHIEIIEKLAAGLGPFSEDL